MSSFVAEVKINDLMDFIDLSLSSENKYNVINEKLLKNGEKLFDVSARESFTSSNRITRGKSWTVMKESPTLIMLENWRNSLENIEKATEI